jgi:peptidyl-prolyl cis-trans isomerase C
MKIILKSLILLSWAVVLIAKEETSAHKERLASKPWYMRDTQLPGGKTIPISPVTLLVGTLAIVNLLRGLSKKSWAEASHILIQDHSDATKQKLQDFKTNQIKNDATKFADIAAKHSSCPSKARGGNLGKFNRGDMAPPFDRAVFDPQSPLEQTIGPIETQFGWHLIYIHKRVIVE